MQELIIDSEFKELLPALDEKTYKSLEENILANGCMFPLVTWENIIIDGYNRHAICTEHGIPFETVEKEFSSREDVIIWIIGNQVARRNLTSMQLTYFRGLHYNTVKGKGGNSEGKNQYSEVESKNSTQPKTPSSAEQLSKQYKVHKATIFNDSKVSAAIDAIGKVSPTAKTKILSGDVAIEKKELQRLSVASEDELKTVAETIEDGTYEKPRPPEAAEPYATTNHPLPTASIVSAITGEAHNELLTAAKGGATTKAKQALRAYIDMLEGVYSQMP